MKRRGPIRDRILAEIAVDPRRSAAEIGAAAGAREDYVRSVASRYGKEIGATPHAGRGPFCLSEPNAEWLRAEANKANVALAEILNGIVTDARLEDQE